MLSSDIVKVVQHLNGRGICDRCLSKRLEVDQRSVRHVTSVLGLTSDFARNPANCPICGDQQEVIRSKTDTGAAAWLPGS